MQSRLHITCNNTFITIIITIELSEARLLIEEQKNEIDDLIQQLSDLVIHNDLLKQKLQSNYY